MFLFWPCHIAQSRARNGATEANKHITRPVSLSVPYAYTYPGSKEQSQLYGPPPFIVGHGSAYKCHHAGQQGPAKFNGRFPAFVNVAVCSYLCRKIAHQKREKQ